MSILVTNFPSIQAKNQTIQNLRFILTSIHDEFSHIFDLDAIEEFYRIEQSTPSHKPFIITLFEGCLAEVTPPTEHPDSLYSIEEITPILARFLSQTLNENYNKDFTVYDPQEPSLRQIAFVEKFQQKALSPENLDHYALDTIDMIRSAKANGGQLEVVSLNHLIHLNKQDFFNEKHGPCGLFIRCNPKPPSKLPQWLTLYKNTEGSYCLYSESPLQTDDELKLNDYLISADIDPNSLTREGMKSALSISSGMRAFTKWNQQKPKGGFSLEADYPSLLVEWVWLSRGVSPFVPFFNWEYFKASMLQKKEGRFSLMDVCHSPSPSESDHNQHMQMRSYNLGLDWLLADDEIRLLTSDEKSGLVSLNIAEQSLSLEGLNLLFHNSSGQGINLLSHFESKGYQQKAKYPLGLKELLKRTPAGYQSIDNAVAGMVLHVFRACAKQRTLNILISPRVNLDEDEKSLILTLMEQNPFVCQLIHNDHPSLLELHHTLQHIFARNRWLQLNGYIPPLIGNFWDEAASYWVTFLKLNPSKLMSEEQDCRNFRHCVDEMGFFGLEPVLKYLSVHQTVLQDDFNPLIQRKDTRPAFYAACPADQMQAYGQLLIAHLQQEKYFPFTEFHLRFVPGANEEILEIFEKLNARNSFQQLSLENCLLPENRPAFEKLLQVIKQKVGESENWTCPIHIPEFDQVSNDEAIKPLKLIYLDINNALVQRARKKTPMRLLSENLLKKLM